MYRLRSMKSLNKYHELEKQLIYFSSVQDEDDIYEGKYVLYFNGNTDLWEGFLMMLNEHVTFNVGMLGPKYNDYIDNAILPRKIEYANRTFDVNKEDLKRFLNLTSIKKLIKILSKYEGKIYESFFEGAVGKRIVILSMQNNNAFGAKLNKKYKDETKWLNQLNKSDKKFSNLLSVVEKILSINDKLDKSEKLNDDQLIKIIGLLDLLDFSEPQNFDSESLAFKNANSIKALISTFLRGLRKISLENCYIASFTSKYNDSRMWSQYTEYNGVCLEFKDNDSLKLKSIESKENNNYSFQKVIYGRPPEFNFFNIMGKISMGYFRYIFPNYDFKNDPIGVIKKVKKNYWDWVQLPVLFKDPSWKEQDEYRLIISDMMDELSEESSRIYEYDFYELKSVILGNRTNDNDKLKIKNILEEKCRKNNVYNFPIYIMYRNEGTGNIDKRLYITLNKKR